MPEGWGPPGRPRFAGLADVFSLVQKVLAFWLLLH